MNTETYNDSLKDLNAKCKEHARILDINRTKETVYLLDLGSYNSAYIIPKDKVTGIMAVIESLEKVQISTLDPSLTFGDSTSSSVLMTKDTSNNNATLTLYKRGQLVELDSFESLSKVGDDFYEVRSRNSEQEE